MPIARSALGAQAAAGAFKAPQAGQTCKLRRRANYIHTLRRKTKSGLPPRGETQNGSSYWILHRTPMLQIFACYESYSLCTAPALEDSSKSVHPPGLKSRSLELIVCSPSSASTLLLFDHNQDSMRFQAHQSRSMSGFDTPGWSTRLLLD